MGKRDKFAMFWGCVRALIALLTAFYSLAILMDFAFMLVWVPRYLHNQDFAIVDIDTYLYWVELYMTDQKGYRPILIAATMWFWIYGYMKGRVWSHIVFALLWLSFFMLAIVDPKLVIGTGSGENNNYVFAIFFLLLVILGIIDSCRKISNEIRKTGTGTHE